MRLKAGPWNLRPFLGRSGRYRLRRAAGRAEVDPIQTRSSSWPWQVLKLQLSDMLPQHIQK